MPTSYTGSLQNLCAANATNWLLLQSASYQQQAIEDICLQSNTSVLNLLKNFNCLWAEHQNDLDFSVKRSILDCAPIRSFNALSYVNTYFFAVLALVAFICFSIFAQRAVSQALLRRRMLDMKLFQLLFSKFNASMGVGFLFLVLHDVVYFAYWNECSQQLNSILLCNNSLYTAVQVFRCLWTSAYLYISWLRSKDLIKQVFPKLKKSFSYVYCACTLLIFTPVVASSFQSLYKFAPNQSLMTYIFQGISSAALLVCDLFLLYVYSRYVSKLFGTLHLEVMPKFRTISNYGVCSAGSCLLFCVVTIVKTVSAFMKTADTFTLNVCMMISTVLMHVCMLLLLLMKLALDREWVAGTVVIIPSNLDSDQVRLHTDLKRISALE
ncbi:hypothetical protein HDU78_001048 [Chytriomyces hyalinus]|nr:hypothetical protein HDU78_001048 [Chytriomyces hyalinus]KAJ3262708.1 hypothetical protein HDU77_000224 [Chytriomyces hyalinus]